MFLTIFRGLMKNMLLAYFNTSEHKRSEVVAVLGHILNFSEDEILKVGTGSHPPNATGWFSGLLSYSGSSQSQQQHDKVHVFVVKKCVNILSEVKGLIWIPRFSSPKILCHLNKLFSFLDIVFILFRLSQNYSSVSWKKNQRVS